MRHSRLDVGAAAAFVFALSLAGYVALTLLAGRGVADGDDRLWVDPDTRRIEVICHEGNAVYVARRSGGVAVSPADPQCPQPGLSDG